MAVKQWNGKPLSLKVIGTNAGTSMDGLDIAHIHYTQESPDAPLKMKLLREGEVAFDGALKSNCCERHIQEALLTRS
jgi:1,6-anhydro-N-acetylmuramate kinase